MTSLHGFVMNLSEGAGALEQYRADPAAAAASAGLSAEDPADVVERQRAAADESAAAGDDCVRGRGPDCDGVHVCAREAHHRGGARVA
jgi:hypothetical protein